jgi:DNA-binding response OmpR family regulator
MASRLAALLEGQGIEAIIVSRIADLDSLSSDSPPNLTLIDMESMPERAVKECVERCAQLKLPVIALVSKAQIARLDASLGISDFVVTPADPDELVARARRVLWRTRSPGDTEVISIGDLAISPATYEVTVKGRRVDLRFKEYELLRLLAASPGRVFTREALLNQIWSYDYLGGTRTVDVHIRRLRSKIEDAEHSFIETIWNVGYRFKDLRKTS